MKKQFAILSSIQGSDFWVFHLAMAQEGDSSNRSEQTEAVSSEQIKLGNGCYHRCHYRRGQFSSKDQRKIYWWCPPFMLEASLNLFDLWIGSFN